MNCTSVIRGKNFPASAQGKPGQVIPTGRSRALETSFRRALMDRSAFRCRRPSQWQIHQLCLKIKPWGHWEFGLEKCVELEIAESVFRVKSEEQRNCSWKKNIINQRVGNNNNILVVILPCAHRLSKAEDEGRVLTLRWGSLVPRLPVETCYMQDILPEERSPSPSHPQSAISLAGVTPQ